MKKLNLKAINLRSRKWRFLILIVAAFSGTLIFKVQNALESGSSRRASTNSAESGSLTSNIRDFFLEPNKPATGTVSFSDDQNRPDPRIFDLHRAAARGKIEEVRKLLDAGVRPDARGERNRTALMYAAWNGQAATFDLVVSYGANMRLRDYDGNTALSYAAGRGQTQMVDYLIDRYGLEDDGRHREYAQLIYIGYTGDVTRLAAMPGKLDSINRINPEDQTPLQIAAGNGYATLVDGLIARGAEPSSMNRIRQTALHWASWNGQTETVRILLQRGARTSVRSLGGVTPLMLAAQGNAVEVVRLLLEKGADPDMRDNDGRSALSIAESMGHVEVAKLLRTRSKR